MPMLICSWPSGATVLPDRGHPDFRDARIGRYFCLAALVIAPSGNFKHLASPTASLRNHSFKHFVYFVKEFDLIEESEQCS